MDLPRIFVLLLISDLSVQSHGPVFLLEPPSHLTFSNTTGSQVSCSAHGQPTPQVEWLLYDGQVVTAVPGLRQSLGNGTLYFPPFRAEDYRKDVHSTVYRCRASNVAGTVISRDVNVRGVVNQHYDIQVHHAHVFVGNTAVLGCVIPSFVREHVTVTSWSRDDSILLPGSNIGGRIVMTYGTGELHIRSARTEDGLPKYSCLTLHSLTQERKRSEPAMLTIIEPMRNMPPKISPSVQTQISAQRETDIHLTCSAQGHPPPIFNWFREINGHLQPVRSSSRFDPLQDILHIRRLKPEDTGRWTCKVSNNLGEQRLDIHLNVTAMMTVHVLPQLQVINSGESAIFNCTVSGSPMDQIKWFRNGQVLHADRNGKVKLLSALVIHISNVTRHDRGMYQCIVRNERESAQGSAELRLGDTLPELQYTFIEQAMKPGPHVSLRCSATGSPPPQFVWFLDGQPLLDVKSSHRYAISQYVDRVGDVVSHLNITNVRVEDGGLYSCRASNSLGSSEHSARLNIYGSPFIRPIGPIKAVAGADATLHCPYSGYPIDSVRWEMHGQVVVPDLRHHFTEGGSLTITRLDPSTDSGFYACYVMNREGETARREIQLIVNSPPILEPFSFPASLQEGGRAQVTCYVTSGDMPIHFAWSKDGEPISAALQVQERAAEFYSMLIFKEVSSKHSGAYTCVASNSAARANYTAHLMVKVAPQWVIEPQDISTLLGNSLLIECSAKGFPEPQITWLKGKDSSNYQPVLSLHNRITLMTNGSMWLQGVGPQDEGHYLCRATNGIGSGVGKVIYVGVNEPARFDSVSKKVSAKRGNPAILDCEVHGDMPLDVTWTHNGKHVEISTARYTITDTKIENGMKSQITISRADREDSGIYKCHAENAFGRNEHVINLTVQERPDPPSMLEIVEVSSRSVKLSWRRSFDGNSPFKGYLVQYRILTASTDDWNHSSTVNLNLSLEDIQSRFQEFLNEDAVISGLQPATVYTIRIAAVNSIDQSAFTEAIVVKTQEEEPSEAPKDVKIQTVGSGEIFLTWSIPPRESWNGELLGYIVTWSETEGASNTTKSMTVKGWATNKLQLTGLRKFTKYDISVRAFNSVSSGPSSPVITGTTKEGVPEAPPQNIMCSEISSQIMKVSWSPPPLYSHGGIILGYKVFYRPISNEIFGIPTTGEIKRTSSVETYLHGLHKFTNYSLKVLAYTAAGDGELSQPLFCMTEEDLPGPPLKIKAAALTGESILVSWLSPKKPNGHISLYTIYCREAGRVGTHTSYNLRMEDVTLEHGLTYEIRSLKEHQLYEFWVSATTSIGEGEPTSIVGQATNSRAPSRIASFSQVLHKPDKSKVFLPCIAVGNPTPRTRWIYRDKPITFSPFYQVTNEGHLKIHNLEPSLSGNYTCSAKNLFGEDEITYTIVVLLPPGPPNLEIQFTTITSIRLHWKRPDDGGAPIQGYTLNVKRDKDDWNSIELSSEYSVYTLENLICGSLYHVYILAFNRVGQGSPSPIQTISTKGGQPLLPKEKEFILTNSTTLQLNLDAWPDGGCPIMQFSIQYKAHNENKWTIIAKSVSEEKILVHNLMPATWYQLKVTAENGAGTAHGLFNFATRTASGEIIPILPYLKKTNETSEYDFPYKDMNLIAASTGVLLLIIIAWVGFWFVKKKRRDIAENSSQAQTEERTLQPTTILEDKTIERDNRKNRQQVYTSSPIKASDRLGDKLASTYEITPYATFSVPPTTNSRSVNTSTLDFTMHINTCGTHLEDEEHNMVMYPKDMKQLTWYKNRYYGNEGPAPSSQKIRKRPKRPTSRADSDSDDTSGSPNGESPKKANYRVPVKPPRGTHSMAYTGYETLLVSDVFRPSSSTESNDVSPRLERKQTPKHIGARSIQRLTSSSSSENLQVQRQTPTDDVTLQPPTGFSDSRELSEAECDRDLKLAKLPLELECIIARYHERKDPERKEFTIHV